MEGKRSAFSRLKIQNGIQEKQIDQLIEYTNSDKLVKTQTNDLSRFKNKDTFLDWIERKRIINTLIDSNENLLGLIWFSKSILPKRADYPFTFAIRIYGMARGKGFGLPFMKYAFKEFNKINNEG